jgi:hypothetical protein
MGPWFFLRQCHSTGVTGRSGTIAGLRRNRAQHTVHLSWQSCGRDDGRRDDRRWDITLSGLCCGRIHSIDVQRVVVRGKEATAPLMFSSLLVMYQSILPHSAPIAHDFACGWCREMRADH